MNTKTRYAGLYQVMPRETEAKLVTFASGPGYGHLVAGMIQDMIERNIENPDYMFDGFCQTRNIDAKNRNKLRENINHLIHYIEYLPNILWHAGYYHCLITKNAYLEATAGNTEGILYTHVTNPMLEGSKLVGLTQKDRPEKLLEYAWPKEYAEFERKSKKITLVKP